MKKRRTLRIGIAPRSVVRSRSIAIAQGHRPAAGEPRLWFSSMESLAKVLSEKNLALLDLIRHEKPQSLGDLAERSGRAKSNLSRTLHAMERFGFVELVENDRRILPRIPYERIELVVMLDDGAGDGSRAAA